MYKNNVDLEKFMLRHDLVWNDSFPDSWDKGAFLGNGKLGALIYNEKEENRPVLVLGNNEVYDDREGITSKNMLFRTPRLPIGKFIFDEDEDCPITSFNMRQHLFDAYASATLQTEKGSVDMRCFVASCDDVIVMEWTPENKKVDFNLFFKPSSAFSPRQKKMIILNDYNGWDESYEMPKRAFRNEIDGIIVHFQPYFNNGGFVIAYKTVICGDTRRLFISVEESQADIAEAAQKAKKIIQNSIDDYENILKRHLEWWHQYYQKSFISIDDTRLESFFYIQMYKIACATRKNGRVPDTTGVWLEETTSWPGTWWNLNTELTYSPLYTANHTEIAKSLCETLKNNFDELINNVPEKYRNNCAAIGRCSTRTLHSDVFEPENTDGIASTNELGNLTWTLFYCYKYYRTTMEKSVVSDLIFPLLKRAIKFYMRNLKKDTDGVYHIPKTVSPEYPFCGNDCNYDLSLLRWGLLTLIGLNKSFDYKDSEEREWKNVLNNLADYPQDNEKGFYIADGVPYGISHRHFSHLLMIYPLGIYDISKDDSKKTAVRSIEYWQSKPQSLEGYSQTGASSMYSLFGDGEKALKYLENLFNGFITPNTMYKEGGGPVLETPLAAASSLLDMLLLSSGDIIRVMPAVPKAWQNVVFENLLAEGAFLISACRKKGKLNWVKIKCGYNGSCRLKVDFENVSDVVIYGGKAEYNDGYFKLSMKKCDTVLLSCVGEDVSVDAVNAKEENCNSFGLRQN